MPPLLILRRISQFWSLIAAMMLVCAAPAHATSGAWQANEDDALLFDLRLGKYRLGDGVRGYQLPGGVCANFSDIISAFDLAITLDTAKGTAQGWAFDEARTVQLNRPLGSVTLKGQKQALASGALFDTPEGWCVETGALSQWIGVKLVPDLGNAIILVQSDNKLPVEQAIERKARAASFRPGASFDMKKLPQARLPYKMWRTPSLDAIVTIGGLKDRKRGSSLDRSYELYGSGEIGRASVDARLSSDRYGVPSSLRMRGYRTDPNGQLLGPLGATHVGVGDVTSFASPIVARSTPGRGVVLSNRPVDQPDIFDRTTLRGELPQGWDAELYRNDQLLAIAQPRTDGRYEFVDIPLLFGMNTIDVLLYGPQGQVRRERKVINVGMDNPPPGKLRYAMSFSQDNHDLVTVKGQRYGRDQGWRGTFALETSLDLRTTLAVQVNSLMLLDERLTYVEGSIRRSIGPALIEVSGAYERGGGHAARAQLVGAFGRTYLTAESIIAKDVRTDRIDDHVTGLHSLAVDHAFDLGKHVVPFHAEARYTTRSTGYDSLNVATRVSTRLRSFLVTGELAMRKDMARHGPDPPDRIEGGLLANGRIGKVRLRGEARWEFSPDPGFASANLIGEWDAGEHAGWRASLGYERGLDRVQGGIGYVRRFDRFALTTSGEIASDGSVAAGLNLSFSLGQNPLNGGMRMSADKQAAYGNTLVRVFRDSNNDGQYQAGEPLEPEVQLTAGRAPVDRLTNTKGLAVIDRLQPFQPVLIGIDSASLADPLLQPKGPGIVVTPRPGVGAVIDIPLVSAGEIDGTLVRDGGGSIEGVDLELVTLDGRVQAVTRSDYDGFFLFETIPYGAYKIRVAGLSAAAGRFQTAPLRDVQVGSPAASVHLGMVAVRSLDQRLAGP
jgi:hypothetical protein